MRAGREVLDEVEADVVVGFGGYVAVPAYLAAWRRQTPIVIHELNVPPGVANRLGMRFTKHVAVGFPHQPAGLAAAQGRPGGRGAAAPGDHHAGPGGAPRRRPGALRAGPATGRRCSCSARSQGARSINLAMAGAAKAITSAGFQVLHVIGRPQRAGRDPGRPARAVRDACRTSPTWSSGYAAADLVLGRGGAMTLAEVTTVGLPAIYVPLPYGNGEQRRNALPVVQAGGGLLVDDARPDRRLDREDGGPAWLSTRRGWPR